MKISSCLRLILLCSALICADLFAQDSAGPQYDVELIVFRNLNSHPTPEDWTAEESAGNRDKPAPVEDNAGAQSGVALSDTTSLQTLPADQLKLTAVAGRLRASRNYRVLSHLGWTQSAVPTRSELSTPLTSLLGDGLSGSAKLSRGGLLHLSLDLRLKDETGASYVLQETRQIKLGEKHYFDHPYFGVVATVTPHR